MCVGGAPPGTAKRFPKRLKEPSTKDHVRQGRKRKLFLSVDFSRGVPHLKGAEGGGAGRCDDGKGVGQIDSP